MRAGNKINQLIFSSLTCHPFIIKKGLNCGFIVMNKKEKPLKIDEQLVKYLTGTAVDIERDVALNWIRQSEKNRRYFDELKFIYEATKTVQVNNNYNPDLFWERVKSKHYKDLALKLRGENKNEKRIFFRDLLKYAALIFLAISIGFTGFRYFKYQKAEITTNEVWNNIEAPYGSKIYLTLLDGSKIWLNAGSTLRYSSLFGQNNRKVFLDGEAYFNVTKDTSKQFIVSTSHLDVKVYGTEFNVKAYSSEDIIQTTLVQGSIKLEGDLIVKGRNHPITLEPNQMATYYISDKNSGKNKDAIRAHLESKTPENENLIISKDVIPIVYTSWKDQQWFIDREPLSSLATKFERRFNIKFVFQSKNLLDYKFTGTLKDETLEQVLNLMKLSAPIQYQIENHQVILSENKYFKNSYDEMLIKKNN